MKTILKKIWELALPYQDKRDDIGHAEVTLSYAKKLITSDNGDEDIIIPSIILHDIGWSQLSEKDRFIIFDHDATKDQKLAVRIMHQDESVRLGRKILMDVKYPSEKMPEILEIVSQHDTRNGFISKNEGLTRDADKLWRFSKIGFEKDRIRNSYSFQKLYEFCNSKIDLKNYFYSETARKIARAELEQRKLEAK